MEMSQFGIAAGFFAKLYLLYVLLAAIWNLFFHPLRRIAGPKIWIAFPLLRHLAATRGLLDMYMRNFHETYGEAVRFGPDEVSFITAQAWKDIYGHGHKQLQKVQFLSDRPTPDIISSSDADHSRFRKSLSHGFSAKNLQDQEPLLRSYIDQLIKILKGIAQSDTSTDMVKWYNLTTFDMIGDLAFGESFGGLRSQSYHYWISTIFNSVKVLNWLRAASDYPLLFKLIAMVLPKTLKEARKRQIQYVENRVSTRLNNEGLHGRGDFMDSMVRHRGGKDGLTDKELVANASILVIAGSETTATLLSGATYWLLRTPHALKRATIEVRSAFQSEEDITFQNATARLPYMLACLDEALRMYPPVPTGLQRVTPPGAPTQISEYEIPAGTKVAVNQLAAYSSPKNFTNADSFIPERWLPEVKNDPTSPYRHDRRDVLQPFSVGPRNCIGRNLAYNEMRLILARVLWNFDLELCEESMDWSNQKTYILWEKPVLLCKLSCRWPK